MVVEWVRSCCTREYRLFADRPDLTTIGRYYPSVPSAPAYPFPHNLWSPYWVSDELEPWPDLGPTSLRSDWYSGAHPFVMPAAAPVGSRACLERGESYPQISLPVLQNGFPTQCYGHFPAAGDPSWVTLNVGDPEIQLALGISLNWLYFDEAMAVTTLQAYLGPSATVQLLPNKNPLVPAAMVVNASTYNMVVISGTADAQQLAMQVLLAGHGIQDYGFYGTNAQWRDASLDIEGFVFPAIVDPSLPVIFVGDSYGAVIAALLAADYAIFNPGRAIRLLTYGMPRPGDQRLIDRLTPVTQVHLANVGDPVPSIPPGDWELIALFGLLGILLSAQYGGYAMPQGQVILDPLGVQTPGNAPTITFAALYVVCAIAVAGGPWPIYSAHVLAEYLRRLAL